MLSNSFINLLNSKQKKKDVLDAIIYSKINLNCTESEILLKLSLDNFEEENHLKLLKKIDKSIKEKYLPGLFSKYISYYKPKTSKFISLCMEEVIFSCKSLDLTSQKIILSFLKKTNDHNFRNFGKIFLNLIKNNQDCQGNAYLNKSLPTKATNENAVYKFKSELSKKEILLPIKYNTIEINDINSFIKYLHLPIVNKEEIYQNKHLFINYIDKIYSFLIESDDLLFISNLIRYFYNPRFSLIYEIIDKLDDDFSLDLIYLLVTKGLDKRECKYVFDNLIYLDKEFNTRIVILKILSIIIYYYGIMDDFIREWIKLENNKKNNKKIKTKSLEIKNISLANNLGFLSEKIDLSNIFNDSLPELIKHINLEIIPSNDLSNFLSLNREIYRRVTEEERDCANNDNAMVMANLIWKEILNIRDPALMPIVLEILTVVVCSTKRFYSARMQSTDYLQFLISCYDDKKCEIFSFVNLVIVHFKLTKKYFEIIFNYLIECFKEGINIDDSMVQMCKVDLYFFYFLIKNNTMYKEKGFNIIKQSIDKEN